jgi:excisionase family DNA binding protein
MLDETQLSNGDHLTGTFVLMTVTEAARALNLETADVVYRLLRTGKLRGSKIGGAWNIDPASVAERKRSVSSKRSSRSNATAERERRRAEARERFAKP